MWFRKLEVFSRQIMIFLVSSAKKTSRSRFGRRAMDDPLGLCTASNPYVEAYRWWLGGGVDLTWRIVAVGLRHLLRDDGDSRQGVRLIFLHRLFDPT